MDRRGFLKTAAGAGALTATGSLATPAISQRAAARALRLVPQVDLANFDPIWSGANIARNAGLLVWDMLYGIDNTLTPRRQMVEAEEVSANGLIWMFRLRPGLKFHDGEPVLAKDAVASINRWAAREQMGQMIKAIENELVAVDDRTFRWALKKPYPKMLLALAKSGAPCCFVDAGADRDDRSIPADRRICRQRTHALRQGRMGAGRQGGVREIRRLSRPAGTRILARGRQAHRLRPH
jgi:peptide/nickel transport system substrate-binding protein